MVSLQKVDKKEIWIFFKDYINELPASLSQTKVNKNTIKNEFDLYLHNLGRHSICPYETKKSKTIQIHLDDRAYSVYLAENFFYAWLINRNLHNSTLEQTVNNKKNYVYNNNKKKTKKRMWSFNSSNEHKN